MSRSLHCRRKTTKILHSPEPRDCPPDSRARDEVCPFSNEERDRFCRVRRKVVTGPGQLPFDSLKRLEDLRPERNVATAADTRRHSAPTDLPTTRSSQDSATLRTGISEVKW
jgi:hypothetical protein